MLRVAPIAPIHPAGLPPGTHGSTVLLRSNEAVFSTNEVDVMLEVTGAEIFAGGFESGDASSRQ